MPLPSQPKLVLILPTPGGWKAESTYTVGHKNTCHFVFRHNSDVSLSIFTFCNNEYREKYSVESYKNLPLHLNYVSTLPRKTRNNIDVNVHNVLLHDGEYQSASKFKCLLQVVLKLSAFCSDAGCQTTAPLINGSVNNVLFQILPDG